MGREIRGLTRKRKPEKASKGNGDEMEALRSLEA